LLARLVSEIPADCLKFLFETRRRVNLFLISLLGSSRAAVPGMDTGAKQGLTPYLPPAPSWWKGGGRWAAPGRGCKGLAAPWGTFARRRKELKQHLVSKPAQANSAGGRVLRQSKWQFL